MKVLLISVMTFCTTLLSCSPTKTNTPAASTDSLTTATRPEAVQINNLDTTWELQSQQGATLNTDHIPQLVIHSADKKFYGNTGCNRMSGSFTIDDKLIKFNDEVMSTKMACEGYNESDFINTLLKVNAYTVKDALLELSRDNTVLLTFRRK